jgi:hypothetical protein
MIIIIVTTWGSLRGHRHRHVVHATVLAVLVALITAYTGLHIVLGWLAQFFLP